jgi:hypothetical protein
MNINQATLILGVTEESDGVSVAGAVVDTRNGYCRMEVRSVTSRASVLVRATVPGVSPQHISYDVMSFGSQTLFPAAFSGDLRDCNLGHMTSISLSAVH